ncbi:helix loop helix DNA-binding domain protein [Ceratobasidium sp. AG-Ba]|nr:helix loop helix DNA-binding domain protein [Ceratobasidium sp. AG-Ba]
MSVTDGDNPLESEVPFVSVPARPFHLQPEPKPSVCHADPTAESLQSRPRQNLDNTALVSNDYSSVLSDPSHSHSFTNNTSPAQELQQGITGQGMIELPPKSLCANADSRWTDVLDSGKYAASSAATLVNRRDSRPRDIRAYQIESEQRRRNNLRSGFARLKEALPASREKCSKVALLERGTLHCSRYLPDSDLATFTFDYNCCDEPVPSP